MEGRDRKAAAWKFALLVLIIGLAIVVVRLTPIGELLSRDGARSLIQFIQDAPGSTLVFIGIYAVAAGFALPGSVLTLVGGAVWGVWPGLIINLVAASSGATLAFFLARLLGRDFVAGKLGARAAKLDRKVVEHGFRTIFILRLIPLVPFNALNYGAGLSGVKLRDYVAASVIGMLPGTFAYTYFAESIWRGAVGAEREAFLHIGIAGGLLVLLSLLPLVWNWWQRRRSVGETVAGAPDAHERPHR